MWGLHELSFKKVIVKFLDELYSDYDVHGDLMGDGVDPSSDNYYDEIERLVAERRSTNPT